MVTLPHRPTAASLSISEGREAGAHGRTPFLGGRPASKARRRLCGQRGSGTAECTQTQVQGSPAGAPGEPRALLLPPERMRSLPRWLPGPPTSLTWGCPRPISLCPPRGCTNLPDLDPRGHTDRQACPGPSHPVRSASHPPHPLLQGRGRLAQCLPPCSSGWSRGGRPPSLARECRAGCWSQPSFQDLQYGQ